MGHQTSRAMLVGLGAAVAAFGTATMLSAATAQTARADDFTDIINAVNGDLTFGQGEFGTAFLDFGSNHVPAGLASFFSGVDDDLWATSTNLQVGTIEALTGSGINGSISVSVPVPADFADAVANAESFLAVGQADFADAATALSAGMFANAAIDQALGSLYTFDLPSQVLFIGGLESLGL
jgi:hypothetical protein